MVYVEHAQPVQYHVGLPPVHPHDLAVLVLRVLRRRGDTRRLKDEDGETPFQFAVRLVIALLQQVAALAYADSQLPVLDQLFKLMEVRDYLDFRIVVSLIAKHFEIS